MLKVFCEVVLKCSDGESRTFRCCGASQKNAEEKLLKEFPGNKVVSSVVLERYDEADYGWV